MTWTILVASLYLASVFPRVFKVIIYCAVRIMLARVHLQTRRGFDVTVAHLDFLMLGPPIVALTSKMQVYFENSSEKLTCLPTLHQPPPLTSWTFLDLSHRFLECYASSIVSICTSLCIIKVFTLIPLELSVVSNWSPVENPLKS